jgi:hypothetical protein
MQAFRPPADNAAPDKAKGWRRDNPDGGPALADDGDVNREFLAARQELARAVERVHQNKPCSSAEGLVSCSSDTIGTPGRRWPSLGR